MVYDDGVNQEASPMYTVKQLSNLAHISIRTLHHYDSIGLLPPSQVGANGYRFYDEAALLRLQQILLYREMDIELMQIKAAVSMISSPPSTTQSSI
jgi:DNA-binding transcriptional MerR regulator